MDLFFFKLLLPFLLWNRFCSATREGTGKATAPGQLKLVPICTKNGKDIAVAEDAVTAHLDQGSQLGPCDATPSISYKNVKISTVPEDPLILTLTATTSEGNETTVSFFDTPGSNSSLIDAVVIEEGPGEIASVKYDEITGNIVELISYADEFQMNLNYKTETVAVVTFEYQGKSYTSEVDFATLEVSTRRDLSKAKDANVETTSSKNLEFQPRSGAALRDLQAQFSSRRVDIRLTQCGQPYTEPNLKLNYRLFSEAGTESGSTWCTPSGDFYYCWVDLGVLGTLDEVLQALKAACEPAVQAIDLTCDDLLRGGQLDKKPVQVAFCSALGAIVDLAAGGPTGEGVAVAAACITGLDRATKTCKVIDPKPIGGPDVDIVKGICDAIDVNDPVDAIQWSIDPEIYCFCSAFFDEIPEQSGVIPSGMIYDFGTFEVGDSEPVIESVSISPFDPAPGQSYVFSAEVSCVLVAEGDSITLNIVGTDGYSNSVSCSPPSGEPFTCTLLVPGAEEGVYDTCTVNISPDGVSKSLGIVF